MTTLAAPKPAGSTLRDLAASSISYDLYGAGRVRGHLYRAAAPLIALALLALCAPGHVDQRALSTLSAIAIVAFASCFAAGMRILVWRRRSRLDRAALDATVALHLVTAHGIHDDAAADFIASAAFDRETAGLQYSYTGTLRRDGSLSSATAYVRHNGAVDLVEDQDR